ncbi:MAG TPA: FAD:protein FMN transferase, partial [Thermoanaerobaculia bacterium]
MTLALLLTAALASADETRARYLMGTTCTITASHDQSIERAFSEIDRIERRISSWKPESELSRVNRAPVGEPQAVSPELSELLRETVRWHRETGGAFNPLLGPLVHAWRVREEGAIPIPEALVELRKRIAIENLVLGDSTLSRMGEAQIEEGGFGKGYAIDRAVDVARAAGAKRVVIDFGGQIGAYGIERGFEVGIAHPESRERAALMLRIRDGSISTSSGSERRFRIGGRELSHIIDPRTGEPLPPSGSATVIHPSALVADILSTALYVLGPR